MVKRLLLLGLILGIGSQLYIGRSPTSTQPVAPPQTAPAVKSAVNEKDVPEMKDILSDNQETRLKAGRRLVERVGVEEALEILEHSTLPHTGEGHLVVHQIGFYAYQKYGSEGILKCKDYFLFACYHGVIIEAASDKGTPAIAKMTDICKESPTRFFQCTHAAGHAILAMYEYDLRQALTTCDELYEKETNFPEAISSCHNGAFMENLFGVHDWGKGKTPKRDWLKDDEPYFPCTAFGEKYQRGCWLNQAARIYQLNKGDLKKTALLCEKTGNKQYVEWCFDNLARQIHPLTNGDTTEVAPLCSTLGDFWKDGCIIVNAGAYYSVGDRDAGFKVCTSLIEPAQGICFQKLMGQIIGDTVSIKEKQTLCGRLPNNLSGMCTTQLGIGT